MWKYIDILYIYIVLESFTVKKYLFLKTLLYNTFVITVINFST